MFDPSQRSEALKQSNAIMRCFIGEFSTPKFFRIKRLIYIYIYIYTIMYTMCPPGCYHNGFMATPELGHRMYGLYGCTDVQDVQDCPSLKAELHNSFLTAVIEDLGR